MNIAKILTITFLVYVGIVATFESLLGYFQPANQSTLMITTTDDSGAGHDRIVARLESKGQMYVAANHWPRAWFNQALEHPDVKVTIDGVQADYTAVPVSEAEHAQVDADNSLGFGFRVLTGFPPRYFVRLDPR